MARQPDDFDKLADVLNKLVPACERHAKVLADLLPVMQKTLHTVEMANNMMEMARLPEGSILLKWKADGGWDLSWSDGITVELADTDALFQFIAHARMLADTASLNALAETN